MRDYLFFAVSPTLLSQSGSAPSFKRAAIKLGGFGLSQFAHRAVANLGAVSIAAVAPRAHDKYLITLMIVALDETT